jgi:hypothetical protein
MSSLEEVAGAGIGKVGTRRGVTFPASAETLEPRGRSFVMTNLSVTVTQEPEKRLREVDPGELAGVSGGGFILVGDGYCGTPVPWPPRPPLAIGPLSYVSNPGPVMAGAGVL